MDRLQTVRGDQEVATRGGFRKEQEKGKTTVKKD